MEVRGFEPLVLLSVITQVPLYNEVIHAQIPLDMPKY
jgi:hypothetical protein